MKMIFGKKKIYLNVESQLKHNLELWDLYSLSNIKRFSRFPLISPDRLSLAQTIREALIE